MKILVADDQADHRALLAGVLERLGHEATFVDDGEAAWRAYLEGAWSVVITDWRMAGIDGLELARRIRARRDRQYPWLVLITAHQSEEDFAAIVEAGVDDFLPKPVNTTVLRARLRVAERVISMMSQVRELEALLPICIYCKSIRNRDSTWERLESYLQEHIRVGLSHGLCPDCYYDRELAPDLDRLRGEAAGHAHGHDGPADLPGGLHPLAVEHLRRFDQAEAPGLLDDLAVGFAEVATREVPALLEDYADTGYVGPAERRRFGRFRQRCQDIGAFQLALLVDPAGLLAAAREAEERQRLVATIREALERVLPEVAALSAPAQPALAAPPARSAR